MKQASLKDWIFRIFFMLIIVFITNRLFFFSPHVSQSTASYILYPLLKLQKIITDPLHTYAKKKFDMHALQEQVEQLTLQNEDLQAHIIALQATFDFQHNSQEVRDFSEKYTVFYKKIAHVLMRSFDETGHIFWLDAGLRQGVELNMIALYKNIIIGRVIHVDPLYSKIALITDKRCKISVNCAHTKSMGIYQGHNSFEPTLEFVPHYNQLKHDDFLISTGQGLVYPQGFAVGKIVSFQVQDVAYKVKVQPLVDLHTLDYVYLVAV